MVSVRTTVQADPPPQVDQTAGVVKRHAARLVGFAKRKIRENNSVATGNLLHSVMYGIEQRPDSIRAWISADHYWPAVEFGTAPHWAPLTTPDGGGLLRWVVAKRLAPGRERMKGRTAQAPTKGSNYLRTHELLIAMSVQMAIAKNGTRERPFLRPSIAKVWPDLVQDLDGLLE